MDDTELALECAECKRVFATIEEADQHLNDDEECGRAQGWFCVVKVH